MNKGEIYYISKTAVESPDKYVIEPGRPAIVVSAGNINSTQNVVTIVYLTSKPKITSPAHCVIRCNNVTGTALCEEIVTVDKARLGKYIGKISAYEMEQLENCLKYVFSLNTQDVILYEDLDKANKRIAQLQKQIEAYKIILSNQEEFNV